MEEEKNDGQQESNDSTNRVEGELESLLEAFQNENVFLREKILHYERYLESNGFRVEPRKLTKEERLKLQRYQSESSLDLRQN